MPCRKAVFSLAVLVLASVPLALAQGTYTQIDYPGATMTQVTGIDTLGDVVGTYQDGLGTQVNGFILSGGTYAIITYPGAFVTQINGIDAGQIVGYSVQPTVGFIYDIATQAFTKIEDIRASATYPMAINNAGTVVGFLTEPDFGFELDRNGRAREIVPRREIFQAYVTGISSSGKLVGYYYNGIAYVNYSLEYGNYRTVVPGVPGALVLGINPAGTVLVGRYTLSSGADAGFLFEHDTLQTLQFPGSVYTLANGMNAVGQVVGTFNDSTGGIHGFTWTPPADAAKK